MPVRVVQLNQLIKSTLRIWRSFFLTKDLVRSWDSIRIRDYIVGPWDLIGRMMTIRRMIVRRGV